MGVYTLNHQIPPPTPLPVPQTIVQPKPAKTTAHVQESPPTGAFHATIHSKSIDNVFTIPYNSHPTTHKGATMLITPSRQEINRQEPEKIVNRLSRNQELRDMAKNCHVKLSPLVVQSKAAKSLIRAAAYSRFQWNPTQKIGPIQGQSWNPGLVVAAFEAGIPYQQIMESKQ